MRTLRGKLTSRVGLEWLARLAGVALFVVLMARFWHPYYGFTRLLQFDVPTVGQMTPALRDGPFFAVEPSGYDGLYYGQLASDPRLRDPELAGGMDNYAYRARRILTPALAHALAGGDRIASVQIYAWLNLAAWCALGAIMWRLLPIGDWHRTAAWLALMFSAGALHSVRLALVDLPALCWLALAWLAWERGRWLGCAFALAAAALSRETSVLAAGVLAFHLWRTAGPRRALTLLAIAIGPLVAWLLYVRLQAGHTGSGWDNLRFPGSGLWWKWGDALASLAPGPHHTVRLATLLTTLALTLQIARFARGSWRQPLWGLGAAYAVLAFALGVPVWEGQPGAATRVLLPLSFAFFLLVGRDRPSWAWLWAGALTVPAGLIYLGHIPRDPTELAAGRSGSVTYIVQTSAGFHVAEHSSRRTWAWSSGSSEVQLKTWPRDDATHAVKLELVGIAPRPLRVRQGGRELWSGEIAPTRRTVELAGVEFRAGRATLELESPASAVEESPGGRLLSFALYGASLR